MRRLIAAFDPPGDFVGQPRSSGQVIFAVGPVFAMISRFAPASHY